MNILYWILGLAVVFFFIFGYKRNKPPSSPSSVRGTGVRNPGLEIDFKTPDKVGEGATKIKSYSFYLAEDKTNISNKLMTEDVDVSNLPDGVTLLEGDITTLDTSVKVKFDKSIIFKLEYDGKYWIGVKATNDKNLSSEIVWGDDQIEYDECEDDPVSCWASDVKDISGGFIYDPNVPDGQICCVDDTCSGHPSCDMCISQSHTSQCKDDNYYCGKDCPPQSVPHGWTGPSKDSKFGGSVMSDISPYNGTSLDDCKLKCASYTDCVGFNRNTTNNNCTFFNSMTLSKSQDAEGINGWANPWCTDIWTTYENSTSACTIDEIKSKISSAKNNPYSK